MKDLYFDTLSEPLLKKAIVTKNKLSSSIKKYVGVHLHACICVMGYAIPLLLL